MQQNTHGAASSALRGPGISPSSSRMLASYLTDIEQLLDDQRWDAALRDAVDLPRIAVALSDPLMRATPEEVSAWGARWLGGPHQADSAQAIPDADRTAPAAAKPAGGGGASSPVPTAALRRLQLRRHARTRARGFALGPDESLDPQGAQAVQTGRTLVEATRRWYARSGVHDPTVQTNLARLAVLR